MDGNASKANNNRSLVMLKERNVHVIVNDVSTEQLAKTVIKQVLELVSDDLF